MFAILLLIAGLLILFRPGSAPPVEPFAVAAVNSILTPACTERSAAAQGLMEFYALPVPLCSEGVLRESAAYGFGNLKGG